MGDRPAAARPVVNARRVEPVKFASQSAFGLKLRVEPSHAAGQPGPGQIRLAPMLMASASTAVLKKNATTACSVTSLRRAFVRMATSEVCDAAPSEVAK